MTTLQVSIGAVLAAPGVAAILAVQMDLLQDYGRLALTQLRVPVLAYQAAMDCHAQNDCQIYLTLTNSVEKDTKGKMQRERSEFVGRSSTQTIEVKGLFAQQQSN
jgi:hypothetical protein